MDLWQTASLALFCLKRKHWHHVAKHIIADPVTEQIHIPESFDIWSICIITFFPEAIFTLQTQVDYDNSQ